MKEKVIEALKELQRGYTEREIGKAGEYAEKLFVQGDDIIILGTSDGEWQFGFEEAKELIKSDWEYWGNAQIDIENTKVSFNDDTAWFVTQGTVEYTFKNDEEDCDRYLKFAMNILDDKEKLGASDFQKLTYMNWVLTHFNQDRKAAKRIYRWIFTLSGVLINQGDKCKFTQLHFSMPVTSRYADKRIYNDIENEQSYKDWLALTEKYSSKSESEKDGRIKEFLRQFNEDFSEGACLRHFSEEKDNMLIGTSTDLYLGNKEIEEALAVYRKSWDVLQLNADKAIIKIHGNTAWVLGSGAAKYTLSKDEAVKIEFENMKSIFHMSISSREKLFKAQRNFAAMLKSISYGEEHIMPIRWGTVLTEVNNSWHIRSIEFSYPFEMILEGKTDAVVSYVKSI